MAKYVAGKAVKLGNGHFNVGEELPDSVNVEGKGPTPIEKLSNFAACMKDGTFLVAPKPVELDVDDEGEKTPAGGKGQPPGPLKLPTLKEWTEAGYGRERGAIDGKLLEGKALTEAYESFLAKLRDDAKHADRKVIEPK
jgi:hypothetical protein